MNSLYASNWNLFKTEVATYKMVCILYYEQLRKTYNYKVLNLNLWPAGLYEVTRSSFYTCKDLLIFLSFASHNTHTRHPTKLNVKIT